MIKKNNELNKKEDKQMETNKITLENNGHFLKFF